jgi:hypothetical protein
MMLQMHIQYWHKTQNAEQCLLIHMIPSETAHHLYETVCFTTEEVSQFPPHYRLILYHN